MLIQVHVQNCVEDSNICTSEELFVPEAICKPFYFVKPTLPYHEYPPGQENLNDPLDHCVHSLSSCQGEILYMGHDEGGYYMLWKAYTEWSVHPDGITFSRTGLGWMRMRFMLKTPGGSTVCYADAEIKVDCCVKFESERPVDLQWQKCSNPLEEFCLAPSEATRGDLLWFWQVGGWIIMVLKIIEEAGGCIPYEWDVAGIGEIVFGNDNRSVVSYIVAEHELIDAGCHAEIVITVQDRCGTEDTLRFKSCCDSEPAAVSIGYTTLAMTCSASQTLTAWGGCAPYVWSKTGGGTLVPSEDTLSALYTAPATNPYCAYNPTINLTDCCGGSGQLKLAVNQYTALDPAIKFCEGTVTYCDTSRPNPCTFWGPEMNQFAEDFYWALYLCNGALLSDDNYHAEGCCDQGWGECDSSCKFYQCPPYINYGYGYGDLRTPDMIAAGCCPINPGTGLPF